MKYFLRAPALTRTLETEQKSLKENRRLESVASWLVWFVLELLQSKEIK